MVDTALRVERERIVREHMEAENVLDFGRALATFSHPRYELIASGEVFDGREEVERYYRQTRAVFPDQRNEIISLRHAEDTVIAEFWLLGTHKGHLGRLAPTGSEMKCRMAAFFIFEGPHLVCERVYFDSATIRRQLTAGTETTKR
jgi:predicted ester cyclase